MIDHGHDDDDVGAERERPGAREADARTEQEVGADGDAVSDASPSDASPSDASPSDASPSGEFDRWLQSAARDYNRPVGAVPAAAMWDEISRALPAADTGRVVPLAREERRRGVSMWWQAAAALLLVAGGIGIGRIWRGPAGSAPGVAATASPEGAPDVAGELPSGSTVPANGPLMVAESPDGMSDARALAPVAPSVERASYDLATLEHLSRAEALLTTFRTPPARAGEPPLNSWARDLLGDTRLLLDSPAATDAQRRALLEDLELILAQIVQLPAESSADRGLVQRSIERGAVLSRIRSSIPAGYASGT